MIDKQGYQIAQALFAMSRGGLFGLGIGKGTPQDIPYVETDFIFSAVIEELGLLFGIGILLTAAVLFVLMIRQSMDDRSNCFIYFHLFTLTLHILLVSQQTD